MSTPETTARCATHPDSDRAETCARCGDFLCAECVSGGTREPYGVVCDACVEIAGANDVGRGRMKAGIAAALFFCTGLVLAALPAIMGTGEASGPQTFPVLIGIAVARGLFTGATWARTLAILVLVFGIGACLYWRTQIAAAFGLVYLVNLWLLLDSETVAFLDWTAKQRFGV